MTFTERTTDPAKYRHWAGHIEADYIYTAGIAGETFFRKLRDEGRLLGSRCEACGTRWAPARLFCEACFHEMRDFVDLPAEGRVAAACVVRVGMHGEPLEEPQVFGLIRFRGFEGGLVHRLLGAPERARAGLAVRPVLRSPESRTGTITDIEGFAPV